MAELNSEHLVFKKRLNTCRNANGNLLNVPNELVVDIIKAWERWPGTAKSFYSGIGLKKQQMGSIIKKAKRILKEGAQGSAFTAVEVKTPVSSKTAIVLRLGKNKALCFYSIVQLMEFLKLSVTTH